MRAVDGSPSAMAQHLRRLARALTGDPENGDALALGVLDSMPARNPSLNRALSILIAHNRRRQAGVRVTPQRGRDIVSAFSSLPLSHREVLALVVIEELSYAETARILDMSERQVLALLSQARTHLAERMEGVRPNYLRLVK
jgi:DNA-directed RNA polymerase specialized sigma24 family protein